MKQGEPSPDPSLEGRGSFETTAEDFQQGEAIGNRPYEEGMIVPTSLRGVYDEAIHSVEENSEISSDQGVGDADLRPLRESVSSQQEEFQQGEDLKQGAGDH